MTRQRLRPAYSDAQLRQIYPRPHDHSGWADHLLRVDVTVQTAKWWLASGGHTVDSAADLSCGDAAILRHVAPKAMAHLGDFAPRYRIQGPIEETIHQISDVDLYVCSETIEHLDDPDAVLADIRKKSRLLLLSTPVDAWDDSNPEHYWAWSRQDVEDMLTAAGWRVGIFSAVDFRPLGLPYCFGIWGAQ